MIWLCFTSFGLLYTGIVVWRNIQLYKAHSGSMVTLYQSNSTAVEFPRVTMCLNSIHSKWKLNRIDKDLHLLLKYVYEGHRDWPSDVEVFIRSSLQSLLGCP